MIESAIIIQVFRSNVVQFLRGGEKSGSGLA
jgi:hypothetical protein